MFLDFFVYVVCEINFVLVGVDSKVSDIVFLGKEVLGIVFMICNYLDV